MRADLYLVKERYADSRTLAQKLIADGAVTLDGRVIRKSSEEISEGAHTVCVSATPDTRYVSRGGLKLEAALDAFRPPVEGARVADIGASTGGFTDCLLRHGAACVYAVDTGHGQLHPRLRGDDRVRVAEGLNARAITPADLSRMENEWCVAHPDALSDFAGMVDGCVMDVSFISQTLIHPALAGIVRDGGWFITLVKPQFELTASALGKGGVVKKESDRRNAVDRVLASAALCGFTSLSVIPSPTPGGDGNVEYLAYFQKQSK